MPPSGFPRFKLDEALLRHAQDLGVQVLRGRSVRKVSVENKIAVDIEDIGILEPDVMMLATGKHELRGIKRQLNAQTKQKKPDRFQNVFQAAAGGARQPGASYRADIFPRRLCRAATYRRWRGEFMPAGRPRLLPAVRRQLAKPAAASANLDAGIGASACRCGADVATAAHHLPGAPTASFISRTIPTHPAFSG